MPALADGTGEKPSLWFSEDVGEEGDSWSDLAVLLDGRVVFAPDEADGVLVFDTVDRKAKTIRPVGTSSIGYKFDDKFRKCARLLDGRVLMVPWNSPSIWIFEPNEDSVKEVGSFRGEAKWVDCAVLPGGKVVFTPYSHPSILMFDPSNDTFEEIGSFQGRKKWWGTTLLPDGRVVLGPCSASSILVFDPSDKSCSHFGDFRTGGRLWGESALMRDGRVVFAPESASSILVFNPVDNSSRQVSLHLGDFSCCPWGHVLADGRVMFVPQEATSIPVFDPRTDSFEYVGEFPERPDKWPNKWPDNWGDSLLLPDGRILLVPSDAPSILLFNPSNMSHEELGGSNSANKWCCAALLPTGKVVFTPSGARNILVVEYALWYAPLRASPTHAGVLESMWRSRRFPDAVIEAAGTSGGAPRCIPVHRAVLCEQCEVFNRMFSGSFVEAGTARVELPEAFETVEAVVEFIYLGRLPAAADALRVLPLAHRLGLERCVAAACEAIRDAVPVVDALRALIPLLGDPGVKAAWTRLKSRVRNDEQLFDGTLRELVAMIPAAPRNAVDDDTGEPEKEGERRRKKPRGDAR